MKITPAQFRKVVNVVYATSEPGYRDGGAALTAADAELIVAIAQLAVAADRVEDPDEAALFDSLAAEVYALANSATTPPTFTAADDDERAELLMNHAAQLAGRPSASLAYVIAYILTVSDLDLAPEETSLIESLREALDLEGQHASDLVADVLEIITPAG